GEGEVERALEYMYQALRIAEGLSLESHRRTIAALEMARRSEGDQRAD
ncbi:MAG: hypothetical protein JWL95_1415, partial [Gemmatimonadetes bacterium]|nr:hypothetical protein [Gemmatimonadota bacterium]